ncbi:MAG TPA: peptidoglycan recognition family protein [Candidatus Brocadiaceae bacterium]
MAWYNKACRTKGRFALANIFTLLVVLMCGCYRPEMRIPEREAFVPPPKPPRLQLPKIAAELERLDTRYWRYIVIHHSASNADNAASMDKYHREVRGWENGLGYHFVIGNGSSSGDGQIEIGSRWIHQINGAHAGNDEYNQYGIGICLVGNFEDSYPTEAQVRSLIELVHYLQQRCNIPFENIIMHRHVKHTACPGKNFPYYELLAHLPQ